MQVSVSLKYRQDGQSHIDIRNIREAIIIHVPGECRVPTAEHQDPRILVRYQLNQKITDLRVVLEPIKRLFCAVSLIPVVDSPIEFIPIGHHSSVYSAL